MASRNTSVYKGPIIIKGQNSCQLDKAVLLGKNVLLGSYNTTGGAMEQTKILKSDL